MEKVIIKCAPFAAKFAQQLIREALPWWPL